jgi:hypothetical protein
VASLLLQGLEALLDNHLWGPWKFDSASFDCVEERLAVNVEIVGTMDELAATVWEMNSKTKKITF